VRKTLEITGAHPRTDTIDEQPLLLTADQASALLGKSARWIYRQVAAGRLPARRFGRTVLFSRIELLQWAAGERNGRYLPPASRNAARAAE